MVGEGSSVESTGTESIISTTTVSKEEDFMVMASEVVSSYPDESELELGLGLTLGCGGGKVIKGQSSVQYGRILTAKDLPAHMSLSAVSSSSPSASSSLSSSSSCSSPPSSSLSKANVSVGTKRSADSLAPTPNVSQAVGWPPVGAYRMNSLVNQAKSHSPGEFDSIGEKSKSKNTVVVEKTHNGCEKNNGNAVENKNLRISTFVKVNMDGIPIGRKVDPNAHSCYEALAQTLEDMFCKPPTVDAMTSGEERNTMVEARGPSKLLDGSSEFVLTYEDKDGDLMLVGDVPWGMFLSSVKRIRIMRASDANGLAPRFQEMSGGQRSKPI